MRADEWRRVEELFHAGLQLGRAERAAYLERECAGDEALRREVESLVAAYEGGHSFIEQPALDLGLKVLSDGVSESLVGRSVGHYKIVRLLGRGGFSAVYLAEDSVLERPVALKFISDHFVGDEWARGQLMKEARAVARLENSNICAVYGIEAAESYNFIVMQYVEGETLAALLREGPPGTERALDLAEQLAGALSAAHARGVVHRDVKPQNIIVNAAGQVKVLDFGLAKLTRQPPQDVRGVEGDSPGQTWHTGSVVGTVAYMSPEQARGEELDCRSDIFSFGVVLCEMLAGRNPLLRETMEETFDAVKAAEPLRLEGLPADAPGGLARVVRRCLEKEPARRYQTTDQLLLELRALRASRGEQPATPAGAKVSWRRHPQLRRYAATALVVLLLFLAGTRLVYQRLSGVHTLAVLPISNRSDDPGLNYLSSGLTRGLYDKLSYLSRLRVKLPTAAAPSADGNFDAVKYGRELKVEAVLTGEIVKRGESLLLHVSLLSTADGSRDWGQTFDMKAGDIFALQDEVARRVSSGLGLWLVGDEQKLLTRRQTDDDEAFRLYMRGRHYWERRDRDNLPKAIRHFEQAVERDPSFAEAWAGLADSYVLLNLVAYGSLPTKEAMDKARFAATRALYVNEGLGDAHTSMGNIKMWYDWDWPEAEREFLRAIALDQNYAPARYGYSRLLAIMGRSDESVRQSEAARDLDPYSPLAEMNYGRALYYARRHDEAAAQLSGMLEKNPDHVGALYMLGLVLLKRGQYGAALVPLERLAAKDRLFAAAPLGYAYGKLGRADEARAILRELEAISKQRHVPSQESAIIHIGLGENDAAFALLEEAYAERFASLAFLTADSIFDGLRPDPRFDDLARRLNLSP